MGMGLDSENFSFPMDIMPGSHGRNETHPGRRSLDDVESWSWLDTIWSRGKVLFRQVHGDRFLIWYSTECDTQTSTGLSDPSRLFSTVTIANYDCTGYVDLSVVSHVTRGDHSDWEKGISRVRSSRLMLLNSIADLKRSQFPIAIVVWAITILGAAASATSSL
jgi:hypothetical protein